MSFHENFDVIGLIHASWGYSTNCFPKMASKCHEKLRWREMSRKTTIKITLSKRNMFCVMFVGNLLLNGLAQRINLAMLKFRPKHKNEPENRNDHMGNPRMWTGSHSFHKNIHGSTKMATQISKLPIIVWRPLHLHRIGLHFVQASNSTQRMPSPRANPPKRNANANSKRVFSNHY